jgi:CheY-like chemotaxis protein
MDSQRLQSDSSPLTVEQNACKLILSVDDDSRVLFARYKLLSSAGYNVISANDGVQALQLFGSNPVDLVLLDYALPMMDGGLVAEAMKEYEPDVPIIMISGVDVPKECLTKANHSVHKGEDPGILLDVIRDLLPSSIRLRAGLKGSGS